MSVNLKMPRLVAQNTLKLKCIEEILCPVSTPEQ